MRRAFALVELLAAAVIFGIAVLAAFQAWTLCFKLSSDGKEQATASQIARSELEVTKVQGFNNTPLGTIVPSSNPPRGTWQEADKYYDENGQSLSSSAATNLRRYKSARSGIDYGVLKSSTSTTAYELATTSLRSVVVRVTRVSDGTELVKMGVHLTKGGL